MAPRDCVVKVIEQIYTKHYKELVLASLVQDKKFLREAAAHLKPSHFEETLHTLTAEIIFASFGKSGEPPSRVGLLTELINGLAKHYRSNTEEKQSELAVKPAEAFVELLFKPIHGNIRDVQESFLEFCRVQDMKQACLEGYLGLEQGNIKWEDAHAAVHSMFTRSAKIDDSGIKLFGVGEQLEADFLEDDCEKYSCGFKSIDEDMYGGIRPGALLVFVSGAKAGKSMLMVQASCSNLEKGKKVLVITLELPAEEIRRRHMAKISGIKYRDLRNRIAEVKKKVDEFWKLNKGDLIIKRFDAYTNVDVFRSYIYSLQTTQNWKPDVIVIDYGDLVRPSRKVSEEERFQQSSAYVEMMNMMTEFNAAGITASQANREGMDKSVVKMTNIAESIAKVQHATHIVTWGQSSLQKDVFQGTLFFAGTRQGISGRQYTLSTDYEKCNMFEDKVKSPDPKIIAKNAVERIRESFAASEEELPPKSVEPKAKDWDDTPAPKKSNGVEWDD